MKVTCQLIFEDNIYPSTDLPDKKEVDVGRNESFAITEIRISRKHSVF